MILNTKKYALTPVFCLFIYLQFSAMISIAVAIFHRTLDDYSVMICKELAVVS